MNLLEVEGTVFLNAFVCFVLHVLQSDILTTSCSGGELQEAPFPQSHMVQFLVSARRDIAPYQIKFTQFFHEMTQIKAINVFLFPKTLLVVKEAP